MIRVTLRGLAARRLRTLLTAMAIVLGVGMVSAAFTISDTMRRGADALSTAAYQGTDAVVSAPAAFTDPEQIGVGQTVPASTLDRVRAVPGVGVATGDIVDEAKLIGSDGKPVGSGPYFGVGYDAHAAGAQRLSPFRLVSGRWATGPGQVVLDAGTAKKQHLGVGDRVQMQAAGPRQPFTVVGISRFGSVKSLGTATTAIFDLRVAQHLMGKGARYDDVLVAAAPGTTPAVLRARLHAALGDGLAVRTAAAQDRFTLDGLKHFVGIVKSLLLIFGGIAVLVGAFTIFNTLSITVAQRSRELALLRAVGATRRQVLRSVIVESLAVGVLGSAVGVVLGLGLAVVLTSVFAAAGLDLPQTGTVFALRTVVASLLVGVVTTLVAGVIPAVRATRVAPVSALRGEAAGSTAARRRRTSRVGIAISALAALVLVYALYGGGLSVTERLLTMVPGVLLLFVGIAMLSSRVVVPLAAVLGLPAARISRSAGELARRNAMRNPGRTASTAAALMIGVALVTFVTVLGAGVRDSAQGTVAKQIVAPHVLVAQDNYSPISPAVSRAAAAVPGVTSITGISEDLVLAGGEKQTIDGVDPARIGGAVRYEYKDGAATDPRRLGPDGAIVAERLADSQHLSVGERFTVTGRTGRRVTLVVRGIESSPALNALGLGQITVAQDTFARVSATRKQRIAFVSGSASEASLKAGLTPYPDTKVLTGAEYAKANADDVNNLLAIFDVMLALAVIVSLFGIVNTLVLSVLERTRELGMLRAVGMSRRQMRRMIRQEGVITALIGAALGIAVGLFLAALAVTALHGDGIGLVVPAGSLATFMLVAALAGMVAAALPARRAGRLRVLDALSYE
jgi:putative ABC transport system permease protein